MAADPNKSQPMFSSIKGYYDALNNYAHGNLAAFLGTAAIIYVAPRVVPYLPEALPGSFESKSIVIGGLLGAGLKTACIKAGI